MCRLLIPDLLILLLSPDSRVLVSCMQRTLSKATGLTLRLCCLFSFWISPASEKHSANHSTTAGIGQDLTPEIVSFTPFAFLVYHWMPAGSEKEMKRMDGEQNWNGLWRMLNHMNPDPQIYQTYKRTSSPNFQRWLDSQFLAFSWAECRFNLCLELCIL